MTGTIVVVRAVGTAWVPALTAPIRALGHECVLITSPLTEHQREFLAPLVDRIVEILDPYDDAELAQAARAETPTGDLIAVLTSEDGLIVSAARAAERLSVGRTPARALEVARNKYLARCALRDAGEPGPRFAVLADAADAESVAGEVGLPAVLKPINGAGSHLVQVVRTVADLVRAYTHACERAGKGALAPLYARPVEGPGGIDVDPRRAFLVESLIPGHEFSLDLVIRAGEIEHVALADKAILDEKFFECGFISPPLDLDPSVDARIRERVDAAVRAVGLDNTVAHVEVRDDPTAGACIIEVNAGRPGGQLLAQIFEMNTGVDMTAELVTASCGWPSTRGAPTVPLTLASLTKYAHGTGRLVEMNGLEKVAEMPDVLAVIPQVRVGDPITDEFEVFAVNLVAAGFVDLDDLMETYRQADSLIELVIEPTEAPG